MEFKFNKELLHKISKAVQYEWLEENGKGSYASSTIIGMNTRREHGLLVVSEPGSNKKIVLLSRMEESVFIENQLHEISTNQYAHNIFPTGYTYLENFEMNPFPKFVYKIDDRLLTKSIFLADTDNLLCMRYELKNQGRPVKLIIKPFIACRYSDSLSNEIQGYNTDSYLGQNFVRWAPRPNMPELNVLFNRGEYLTATLWYHNFTYPKNASPNGNNVEDLLNPGFFQVNLQPYETFDLFLSSDDISQMQFDYEDLYRREFKRRKIFHKKSRSKTRGMDAIKKGLQHRIYKNDNQIVISASSLNNRQETRDILFTIPGLLLVNNRNSIFKKYFLQLLDKLNSGLLPDKLDYTDETSFYTSADLSLWLINFGYIYFKRSGDLDFFKDKVFDAFRSVYDHYVKGTLFNIYAEKEDLIFCGDKSTSLSWMPYENEQGEVIRYGKLLEINALWYSVIRILQELSAALGKGRLKSRFNKHANRVYEAFNSQFVTESGSVIYDFINHENKSKDFTVNQIIPLALPFSCIDNKTANAILTRIDTELVTPYGLRVFSESCKNDPFTSFRQQGKEQPIWPWAIAFYMLARRNYRKENNHLGNMLSEYFNSIFDLVDKELLGYLPQAVLMNEEAQGQGIEDFAPSAACLFWAQCIAKSKK